MEVADNKDLYGQTKHPYTKALLSAIPKPDPRSIPQPLPLKGEIPSVENPPSGCRFHTRCPHADGHCAEVEPELLPNSEVSTHLTACHYFR
ncbi:MAG: hypothetical protein MI749_06645 [Desulfovibrionales bacterium]|nr:hypothetical protein [Desulfovibrionales bacterium]